jgi:serine/threonine protein kinase
MITVIRVCRKCGAKIFSDAPEGLCTGCVLETALEIFPDASVAGGADPRRVDKLSLDDLNAAPKTKKSARAPELLGELGDYALLEEIGRGGQGVVFRARQKSLNRIVALKVIGLGQWSTSAHLKRFRLEAEAAASLDHPYIVPIYEVGERYGQCYFSMKFVEGGQLGEVVRPTPISIRQAAELVAKVARTVHYAHEHGILHRDIKPGNILLDANGEPHLTDFGLARLLETKSTVTHTMDVLGTPSYMAPEQASGHNEQLTSATDVYGLGAVFYQLLTGHPPFAGGTTYETVRLVLEAEPRQPRLWNPKIDLSEVFGERSKAPLLVRSRAGRRLGTLAEARTNPRQTKRIFHTCPQMGAKETSYCCVDCVVGCFGSGHGLECLEKRVISCCARKEHRCASV